jgi:amidohydrolase
MNAPDTPFAFDAAIRDAAERVNSRVVAWRRDFHENPELGNREVRTGGIVAKHLRELGFDDVREKVAHTGVVGVLKGGKPGPVVALRADMDALPVTEETDVPFKSMKRTHWNGVENVGIMHACGHDAHTAILMATAEVLAAMKDKLSGSSSRRRKGRASMPPSPARSGAPAP